MLSRTIVTFVMSGGVGSRLWPLSREDNPKQLHDLTGGGSMLLKTLRRMESRRSGETPVLVIGAERHAQRILSAARQIDTRRGGTIFEPMGRNTAAAVAIATLETLSRFGDELVLVVPSDHEISTDADFWATVDDGVEAALGGSLVIFGIEPTRPETGYGYIETAGRRAGVLKVERFVEKPDHATAETYLAAGNFYWNAGIFLFRASTMRDAFLALQPDLWTATKLAFDGARREAGEVHLPADAYSRIPSISIDYAVMEKSTDIAMAPARFNWSDLGSWQSIYDLGPADEQGNVVSGDVVAVDCHNSFFKSTDGLLTAVGVDNLAVVKTGDATFVAPIGKSQDIRKIVERLEKAGRPESKITPESADAVVPGGNIPRVRRWLFDQAFPLWSTAGVDEKHGGFHEALLFDTTPADKPKRIRTMARQLYVFATAKTLGWQNADRLIEHGMRFLLDKARTPDGGFVRTLSTDGKVIDPTEDSYDLSCVLLALAEAHRVGHAEALTVSRAAIDFMDWRLADTEFGGFFEATDRPLPRRSNPHMHLLEAYLAWFTATRDEEFLERAARIVDLGQRVYDAESWTLGEYFNEDWGVAAGESGQLTEPGHQYEWAALLCEYASLGGTGLSPNLPLRLYSTAAVNGTNRRTGLAYGAVSRDGRPLDPLARSWPQAEAIKASIQLDKAGILDLGHETEDRVARLFKWHLDPAPAGLYIDRIDGNGASVAADVPASILYHLTGAFAAYLRE